MQQLAPLYPPIADLSVAKRHTYLVEDKAQGNSRGLDGRKVYGAAPMSASCIQTGKMRAMLRLNSQCRDMMWALLVVRIEVWVTENW